jgi:hypothetical protein
VLPLFDIFKEAGHSTAVVRSFVVFSTIGQLEVQFEKKSLQNPKISAIEIVFLGSNDQQLSTTANGQAPSSSPSTPEVTAATTTTIAPTTPVPGTTTTLVPTPSAELFTVAVFRINAGGSGFVDRSEFRLQLAKGNLPISQSYSPRCWCSAAKTTCGRATAFLCKAKQTLTLAFG